MFSSSTTPNVSSGKRIVVPVGDASISDQPNTIISTYALGTCIGVIIYDQESKTGGLLHSMLPDSKLSPEKADIKPYMFTDTGLALMFKTFESMGANLAGLKVLLVGGASSLNPNDFFKIGQKNQEAAHKFFKSLNINNIQEQVGGVSNRTVHFNLTTGEVTIKTGNSTETLTLS